MRIEHCTLIIEHYKILNTQCSVDIPIDLNRPRSLNP